eukprot:gene16314-18490_t
MASYSKVKKDKVVVIGCGPAGSQALAALAKKNEYQITCITPFEYMEVSLTMTKTIAAGPDSHTLHDLVREDGVEYIIDQVNSISATEIRTESGRVIPFDVALVAVGQKIPLFYPEITDTTANQRRQSIRTFYSDLLKANHIVIAGGGAIGTEAAADIKLRHKEKKVTLIHSESEVLTLLKDPFRLKATAFLEKIGIELTLSDRVDRVDNGMAYLGSGRSIPCDLYIPAFAQGGNATFLPGASKDSRNYAKVDDTFKVDGFTNVFAVGDCTNYDKVKGFPRIGDHLPVALFNLEAVLKKQALKHHVKGVSFMGKIEGPMMVAFGHELPEGYGVGPALPGCMGGCCWVCCCCQTPAGHCTANMKSDFNKSVVPKKGKGISS